MPDIDEQEITPDEGEKLRIALSDLRSALVRLPDTDVRRKAWACQDTLEKVIAGGGEPLVEKVGRTPRYVGYGLLVGTLFGFVNTWLFVFISGLWGETATYDNTQLLVALYLWLAGFVFGAFVGESHPMGQSS